MTTVEIRSIGENRLRAPCTSPRQRSNNNRRKPNARDDLIENIWRWNFSFCVRFFSLFSSFIVHYTIAIDWLCSHPEATGEICWANVCDLYFFIRSTFAFWMSGRFVKAHVPRLIWITSTASEPASVTAADSLSSLLLDNFSCTGQFCKSPLSLFLSKHSHHSWIRKWCQLSRTPTH